MTQQNKDDAGQAEMQRLADEAAEKGYIGESVDPTPDANYTLGGVTSGAPTPETDAKAEAEARQASGIAPGPLQQAADEAADTKKAAKKEQK